jgi:hypothetical protein
MRACSRPRPLRSPTSPRTLTGRRTYRWLDGLGQGDGARHAGDEVPIRRLRWEVAAIARAAQLARKSSMLSTNRWWNWKTPPWPASG